MGRRTCDWCGRGEDPDAGWEVLGVDPRPRSDGGRRLCTRFNATHDVVDGCSLVLDVERDVARGAAR